MEIVILIYFCLNEFKHFSCFLIIRNIKGIVSFFKLFCPSVIFPLAPLEKWWGKLDTTCGRGPTIFLLNYYRLPFRVCVGGNRKTKKKPKKLISRAQELEQIHIVKIVQTNKCAHVHHGRLLNCWFDFTLKLPRL